MANPKQLKILKQGVGAWNKWQLRTSFTDIDLDEADLKGLEFPTAYLIGAHLNHANLNQANLNHTYMQGAKLTESQLREAKFFQADLRRASFTGADLSKASLTSADLRDSNLAGANLSGADFSSADLSKAALTGANLTGAKFSSANLREATLKGADLSNANITSVSFFKADLREVNLSNAIVGSTDFGGIDLSKTYGIETVQHRSPSTIGTDTIKSFRGKAPQAFLRGCGLPDWEIESSKLYNPDLTNEEIVKIQYRIYDLRASQAIQISPLFISYSHQDKDFVDYIDTALTQCGVRFWRDIHDLTAGRIESQIDRAMRLNPTVLLILSEHSLQSDWVEHEVRTARSLEKEMERDVLCPVALDDSWKNSPWAKRVMEQVMEYNVLDFSEWKDDSKFDNIFTKLIDGLKLFYK